MPILNAERLYQAVKNKSSLSTNFTEIDHSRPFMPESLTQLYHTEHYQELSTEQRLRYNQLFALRAIEQLMTLEARFISLVIRRSQRIPILRNNTSMQYCMDEMVSEEVEHYNMFRSLNRLAEPSIYQQQDMYFARMSLAERVILELLALVPGITPFLLWTLLILEEFSTHISQQMLQQRSGPLGNLEENFIRAHREHLKDESRHVAICANSLREILRESSIASRKMNALLLHYFMDEYMTPKRGGVRVIRHLCKELPALKEHENEIIKAIRKQSPDPLIWGAINNASAMPTTNKMMQRYPEFSLSSNTRATT